MRIAEYFGIFFRLISDTNSRGNSFVALAGNELTSSPRY
jgi:hypothetical protein